MKINIEGTLQDSTITKMLEQSAIKATLEAKANERITSILNKHFNELNSDQTIRQYFNKAIGRVANTDHFKSDIKEMLKDTVSEILKEKDFSKMIDDSCKRYIDSVVQKLKA